MGPRHHSQPLLSQKTARPELIRQQTQPAPRTNSSVKYETAVPIESDDDLIAEIEKEVIQRRRRIFSQHRQYQQWRKKQFSYDAYTFRPTVGAGAAAKRRLYKRQFSCMEKSGGRSETSSADSRDSKYNYGNNSGSTTKRNSVNSVSVLIASFTMVVVLKDDHQIQSINQSTARKSSHVFFVNVHLVSLF